jgi:hypothetical protein
LPGRLAKPRRAVAGASGSNVTLSAAMLKEYSAGCEQSTVAPIVSRPELAGLARSLACTSFCGVGADEVHLPRTVWLHLHRQFARLVRWRPLDSSHWRRGNRLVHVPASSSGTAAADDHHPRSQVTRLGFVRESLGVPVEVITPAGRERVPDLVTDSARYGLPG